MLRQKIFNFFTFQFFIYLFRCLLGFSIGYLLMLRFPEYDLFWTLLSIILVISPEEKDSPRLTIERVSANFIGAVSGILVFFINLPYFPKVMLGIIFAVLICKFFNLMNVVRSSIVSVLVILIEHKDSIYSPFERFLSVLLGCLIGLTITLSTAYILKKTFFKNNTN